MTRSVLFFFPHNPYPPRSGAHHRCLSMLTMLKQAGCHITLVSSTLTSETAWNRASIEALEGMWVRDVQIYPEGVSDRLLHGLTARYYGRLDRDPPLRSILYAPPGMRRWFRTLVDQAAPDLIFVNYVLWDSLIDHDYMQSATRVIDTYDLFSLTSRMQRLLREYFDKPPAGGSGLSDDALREDFFASRDLAPTPDELSTYDSYTCTIAITRQDAEQIAQQTAKTRVLTIPMVQSPRYVLNTYSDSALFAMGPNLFNLQGYCYFVRRVLPVVLEQEPSFCLGVTGTMSSHPLVATQQGINVRGFVPELGTLYTDARFAICPVFGGTGQQIKIVEAMAHGLAVVALRHAAERSPLVHGINGLVAENASEFAECVVQLWKDAGLCRRLGDAARQTIAQEHERAKSADAWTSILAASQDTRG